MCHNCAKEIPSLSESQEWIDSNEPLNGYCECSIDTPEQAAETYAKYVKERFGEFARIV